MKEVSLVCLSTTNIINIQSNSLIKIDNIQSMLPYASTVPCMQDLEFLLLSIFHPLLHPSQLAAHEKQITMYITILSFWFARSLQQYSIARHSRVMAIILINNQVGSMLQVRWKINLKFSNFSYCQTYIVCMEGGFQIRISPIHTSKGCLCR